MSRKLIPVFMVAAALGGTDALAEEAGFAYRSIQDRGIMVLRGEPGFSADDKIMRLQVDASDAGILDLFKDKVAIIPHGTDEKDFTICPYFNAGKAAYKYEKLAHRIYDVTSSTTPRAAQAIRASRCMII